MISDFHRGDQIGKYQIITQLSVGGMAELFLGFTAGPGGFRKYVAIKRILPDVRSNESFERMFLDEARITAAFNHPNIAQVYELGREEDGLFLAMEFIAGQNLDQLTAAYLRRREPIPLGLSVAIMRDVCLALHYAHTFTDPSGRPSPIIHRDVAQKNVMVTYDGVVKLLDFGIAKARNSLDQTRAGMVKGTAGYMSPEQVRGQPLDGRSDVFSAAVVLWELITGERLFAAKTEREEMASILKAPIASPRHRSETVPEALAEVVLKALERDPKHRIPSAKEMARALDQAAGPLMLDTDQRAALMRQLFEKKVASTRALLESADDVVAGKGDAGAAAQEESAANVKVETALRVEAAPKAEPAWKEPSPKKAPPPAPPRPADTDVDSRARHTEARAAPTTLQAASAPSENKTLNTALWVAVLGCIVLGGSYLAMTLTRTLDADVKPEPTLQTFQDPRLKVFPEPGQPVDPAGLTTDGGVPASATAAADPKDKDKDDDKPSKPRGPQGKMTLIINPEAEVFLGKRSLGKTPLFNATLPVGTHLLRIVGPDKKARMLSVPIEAGKTSKHRFALKDIPEAH
ncbi:serine/threonine-protein kinase [Hyalangium minutum]|uniref:Serine/threonine protein kinase n=1 Tax=Hyalangium minutum TaxID=394096 RepID=A0A085WLG5_9BACT|nr:serine/threonine-protein kinase [Hyalangium minutum]KFE68528.1 serine/threonine protein kinase [Hyalangium minutum]